MAQLANCPQCDHDFIVPEGLTESSWARCPSCRAFFKLSDAKPREISTLEIVESTPEPSELDLEIEDKAPAKTLTDFSSMATWSGEAQDDADDDLTIDFEDAAGAKPPAPPELNLGGDDLGLADDLDLADEIHISDELNIADDADATAEYAGKRPVEPADDLELNIFADRDETVEVEAKEETLTFADDANEEEELDFAEGLAALKKEFGGETSIDESSIAQTSAAAEAAASDTPELETPEAAAQRIDAWFRSAKTLSDLPAIESAEPTKAAAPQLSDEDTTEPWTASANNATVDIGSLGIQGHDDRGLNDDFELDAPAESPQDIAAWEDSQHMERLLASIGDQPQDEFEQSAEHVEAAYPEEPTETAAEWAPDAAIPTSSVAVSQLKRSMVRTMAMTLVGGLMAIPLAGFTLLWLRGPDADFLGMAQYIPQVMLPSSFKTPPKRIAIAPPTPPAAEETPAEKTEEPIAEAPAKTEDAQQATFNAPVDTKKPAVDPDDRYATGTSTAEKPATEPGLFDAPPATPVKEAAPQNVSVRITGAPTFSVAELSAALQAAKTAEPGLVNGNMADGRDVARAKGLSYSVLADLAQKVMFVEPSPEAEKLQHEAEALFRTALSTTHTRDEVAQIVPMWIGSANRKHGGVFFAATLAAHDNKGTVTEFTADLGGGKSLPVLVPATLSEQLKGSAAPVAVVGWIVSKPAESVTGYTGAEPQAIVAGKIVPLQ